MFAAVALVLRATHALAADIWVEAKSPSFTVISNAGEKKARNVAWQFEQIRYAIEKGLPWARVRLNRPVLILAVKNEASMKDMAPAYWEKGDIHPGSVLSSLGDRHYILLRTDVEAEDREGVNPYRQAYWSYSALTIDSSFRRPLPLWFSRGLAAVLSNSIVRDSEIQFGRAIPGYVKVLQQQPRLRLEELLAVNPKSEYFTTEPTRTRFDAQCWLLMHYMLFGDTEQGNWSRINTLSKELTEGKSSPEAIKDAYGAVEKLDNESLRYLKQGLLKYVRMRVDGAVPAEKYAIRNLTAVEADAGRAGFHVSMGRLVDARAILTPAMQADGQQPLLSEIEGLIFDRENKPAAAREAYQKAADLNSSNFYVYLRLANLSLPTNDRTTLAAAQRLLAKSIALNDVFAPSYSSLANVLLQLNQPDGALGLADRAVNLEPGQFNYHLLSARVFQRLSRRDDARKVATEALELALTDQQREAAQAFLASLDRSAPPPGIVGGVVGGLASGGSVAPPPPPPPPPAKPVRVGGSTKTPAKVKDVRPVYPADARDARVQGSVMVEATISPDGTVQNAKIIRSIPLLDAAALDAVRQWEFSPTTVNGQRVPVIMAVTVTFTLQ
jgi:TonB family protein